MEAEILGIELVYVMLSSYLADEGMHSIVFDSATIGEAAVLFWPTKPSILLCTTVKLDELEVSGCERLLVWVLNSNTS